jgi:hypothetical protein
MAAPTDWSQVSAVATAIAAAVAGVSSLVVGWQAWETRKTASAAAATLQLEADRRRDEEASAWLGTHPVLEVSPPESKRLEAGDDAWTVRVRNIGGDRARVTVHLGYDPPGGQYSVSIGASTAHIDAHADHTFDVTAPMRECERLAAQYNAALAEQDRKHWPMWGRVVATCDGTVTSAEIAGSHSGAWLSNKWELFTTPDGRRGTRTIRDPAWPTHPVLRPSRLIALRTRLASWVAPSSSATP